MTAYSFGERMMAPLSRDLAGLILPRDTCGEILAEIWSKIEIDVVAQYVEQKDIPAVPLNEM